MADWDADSPQLRRNLIGVLRDVRERAVRRDQPAVEDTRRWHRAMMTGLRVPDGKHRGRFRGERGLETTRVWIGAREGVGPVGVARALAAFERTLQRAVAALDVRYPPGQELDVDGLAAVIDLSAWAHAEWVRMHPLANGNGRTARMWANAISMRYALPPAVRLRRRPAGSSELAGAAAMGGDWRPTATVFRTMLEEVFERGP